MRAISRIVLNDRWPESQVGQCRRELLGQADCLVELPHRKQPSIARQLRLTGLNYHVAYGRNRMTSAKQTV